MYGLAFDQRTLLSSGPRERGLTDETVRHRLCNPISTPILILLPRAREPGNALMSKTVDNTAIRPYRTLRFGGKHEATRGTMHRYLPPVDEREEAPLARNRTNVHRQDSLETAGITRAPITCGATCTGIQSLYLSHSLYSSVSSL